jgi:hypothetical protein
MGGLKQAARLSLGPERAFVPQPLASEGKHSLQVIQPYRPLAQ